MISDEVVFRYSFFVLPPSLCVDVIVNTDDSNISDDML